MEILTDFDHSMIVGTRLAGLSISEAVDLTVKHHSFYGFIQNEAETQTIQ